VRSRSTGTTGYGGIAPPVAAVLSGAAHAQRCLLGEIKSRSRAGQVLMQCRLSRHCVGYHYGPFYSSSCSEMPALQTQMEIMHRAGAHALQAIQALRRESLWSFLQQLMLGDACPANSNGAHVASRCSCHAGYAGTAAAVATVLSTAAHAQRCLPCELKTEVMCRAGAHGRQAMEALRRLALRSSLQRLMLRDACPANSNGDHVPSRCSCNAGYAGTASAVNTVISTAAHPQRCLPCELKWRSSAE
jgi:hypothetical protein